jgi:predicted RNA-binding Zn ribbon-like protein
MGMKTGQGVAVVPVPGRAGTVELIGGALCLDFANTVAPRVEPRHPFRLQEFLTAYPDVVAWGRHAGVLSDAAARRLLAEAAGHPEDAAATFAEAIALRETIYRIFLAIARGAEPDPADVDTLGAAHAHAMAHTRVVHAGGGFDLAWGGDDDALDRPLWPIARSAVELLTGADPARIKDCPTGGEGCGWLFYDTSKNNSRRWCSMRGCGTPAKERRRAERRRG